MQRKVALIAVAALAIYAGFLAWQNDRLRDKDIRARAAIQAAKLEAAGWKRGVEATQAEMVARIPALEKELAAAKRAKAPIAIASHWEGRGAEVAVPCTVVMGPPAGDMTPPPHSADSPGESGAPPSVAVTPHVRIDDAVALDDAGGIFVARKVQAQLTVGTSWASAWEPIEADAASTTVVNPELTEAWAAWKNPPPRIAILPRGIKQSAVGVVGGGRFGPCGGPCNREQITLDIYHG